MAEQKKETPTTMQTHGFAHKPFVFQDFSDARPSPSSHGAFMPAFGKEEAAQPEVQKAAPVAPSFSEEELLAAQKEAMEMGREQGRIEAQQGYNAAEAATQGQLLATLDALTQRIDAEIAAQDAARKARRAEVVNIVLMVARKLAGKALDTQPLGAIEGMMDECLNMLAGEARLSLTVAPALEAPLKKALEQVKRDGQHIDVLVEETMQVGDCRIRWPDGKAERDQEQLWKEMEAIITRALAPSKSDE